MWGCQDNSNWMCFPVPPTPPQPPLPPPPLRGPIQGVTTGFPASAGMVGEFLQRTTSGSITVGAGLSVTTTITALTLTPGDWDVEALMSISELFTSCTFVLNPTIMGASGNMYSAKKLPGATSLITVETFLSQRTQILSAAVSIPLQFDIVTNNSGGTSATGNYAFTVNARRMR